ncbi:kelch-like protein 23 [Lates japonicus]|uniref:Kelch-like protein 23 n=1 Tax=Lates japonicus TaxID=270547 RepID=A0AAD3MK26_LATJO|nr:kelch-like protein 23 [Lates japonicus]
MLLLPAEYWMCLVSVNSSLYLVGGQTTLAECFDPHTEEWVSLASMTEGRIEFWVVAMLGCVYITGAYSCSKGTYLQSMEKYDLMQIHGLSPNLPAPNWQEKLDNKLEKESLMPMYIPLFLGLVDIL